MTNRCPNKAVYTVTFGNLSFKSCMTHARRMYVRSKLTGDPFKKEWLITDDKCEGLK